MKFKMIVATFACCLLLNAFSGEVLYWMVDDFAAVHYENASSVNIQTLVPDSIDTSLAARVRVTGGDIMEDTFLNLYIGEGETWDGSMGIDFGDVGGYWGCGVPTGNQAPLAEFSGAEYSFMIELGNYTYDEATDAESWTTIASSASRSYGSLLDEGYVHLIGDLNPPKLGIWNPHDFYAIPEPSPGMLILFSLATLLLARKKDH